MCSIEKLFSVFSKNFDGKKKCESCIKRCTYFCPDNCLDYYGGRIPDYNCSYLRDAYVMRYFPTHKAELVQLFSCNAKRLLSHLSLEDRSSLFSVLSLGTGPGTDLMAFCEWLKNVEMFIDNSLNIEFTRVDINNEWKSQYDQIRRVYKNLIDSLNASFTWRRRIGDAFNLSNMPDSVDLSTASYLLSELTSQFSESEYKDKIQTLWKTLKSRTNKKSALLINDRPEQEVRSLTKYLFELISADFAKSSFKEYCYSERLGNDDIVIHENSWCGCHLPNEIRTKFKSKTKCTSYQSVIIIDK